MKLHVSYPFRPHLLILAAGSSLLAVSSASAQSGTWNVDANGLWGTDTNWLSNTIASGSGETANFTNDITADCTVSLDSDRTLTNVVFGDSDTATAGSWILNNNSVSTNNLILAGTTPTITVNALGTAKTATISAIIEGSAGLTKAGAGTLILSGVNTYTGTTIVDAGELRWGGDNALGSDNLTVNSGGTVTMDTFTDTVGTITLNRGTINVATGFVVTKSLKTGSGGFITTGGTVINWPGIGLGGNFAYNTDSGNETTATIQGIDFNGGSRTFNIADGVQAIDVDISVSLFNPTNANLNFIKTGAGTMRNSGLAVNGGTGNYNLGNGTTTIQDGTLLLNKAVAGNHAVGGLGLVTVGDGMGLSGSAVLRYVSVNDQILNNAITISSDGLFDLNGKNETTSGALTHSSGGSLTTGVGTLTLGNATNTISGASTVTGNLTFSGTAATNLTLGGTANINGTTTFSGGAGGGITSTGTPQIQGTLALGTANRTISVTSGTLTIGAQITGSTGTTTKSGAGTLTLSNSTNSYSGAITINAGTLKLGANDVLPNALSSTVSIGTAILDADTRTDTAGTLDVTGAATINLGVGAALAFADSKAVDWTGGTLNITGTLGATSLRFGDSADDLTSVPGGQLSKISVNGSGLGTYVLDANGYLVPGGGNTNPTISDIANQSIPSGTNTGALVFTVGDVETAPGALIATGSSSNTTLVPNAHVVIAGNGGIDGSRTVTVTPVSGLVGSTTITVTVTDGGSLTAQDTFTLTVTDNYLSWATLNGVTGGVDGDHDNDGVKNLVEYALVDGGERGVLSGNTITFNKRGGVYGTDLTYIIETSETLASGSWSDTVMHTPAQLGSPIRYTFTPSTPVKEFARLKVVTIP